MIEAYAAVQPGMNNPASAFKPAPKVDSMLVSLRPLAAPQAITDHRQFAQVVRLAFGQRRKKLSNALKVLEAGDVPAEMGWSDLRAEKVSVEPYMEIVGRLGRQRIKSLVSVRSPVGWLLLVMVAFVSLVVAALCFMGVAHRVNRPRWVAVMALVPIVGWFVLPYLAFMDDEQLI